eukprot:g3737.t1
MTSSFSAPLRRSAGLEPGWGRGGTSDRSGIRQDADAQRRAKAAPKQLWLKAPSRIALEGEYTKVPERLERGQAVWKQHCGPGWIYSTSGGRWFITDREDGISASAKPTRSHMSTGLASLSAGYPMPVPASECYLLGRTATFSKLAALGPRVCPSLPPGLENDQMEVLESLKAANLMHLAGLLGTPEYSKPKAAPAPITSGLPLLLSREDVAIGKVVRSQDGAEVVSRLLATDASAPPLVVTSLLPELPYLASHPNGAGVISDLFVACRKARDHGSTTIPAMTRRLQGSLLRLTKDRWGCRVMQAALEEASPEFQQAFASELQGKALKLCQHLHANFVLQKYVELLPSSAGAFILQELTPHALEVAAHVYGCRVLQRLIEHCSKEPELSKLVESLLATVPQIEKLLKDPFGSNVLRALVAHGTDAQVKVIMAAISTNVLKFAKHKHASLVFERCLEASSERSGDFPERDLLVDPLADGGEENAVAAALHIYACRVLQRLIECCGVATSDLVDILLQPGEQLQRLVKDPYSSNVIRSLVVCGNVSQVQIVMRLFSTDVMKFSRNRHASLVLEKCLEVSAFGVKAASLTQERRELMNAFFSTEEGEYISCGYRVWRQEGGNAQLSAVAQQAVERWAFWEDSTSNCRVRGTTACEGSPHLTMQWQMLEGGIWRDTARFCEPQPAAENDGMQEDTIISPVEEVLREEADERTEAVTALFSPDTLSGVSHVPGTLRDRVMTEVLTLLAQAQFTMSPQQGEVDLDHLECCHQLLTSHPSRSDIDDQEVSREVLRTVLRGWSKPMKAAEAELIVDDGTTGCESQVLGGADSVMFTAEPEVAAEVAADEEGSTSVQMGNLTECSKFHAGPIPGLRIGELPHQAVRLALHEFRRRAVGPARLPAATLELGVGAGDESAGRFAALRALRKLRERDSPSRARKVWAVWCRQRFQDVRPLSEFPACHAALRAATEHFGVPKQLGELNVILRSYAKGDWLGRHVDDVQMFAEPVLATILQPGGLRDGLHFSLPHTFEGLAAARADAEDTHPD